MSNENHTILIVAATGKVGRRLTARLAEAGHDVRPVSRSTAIRFDWHDESTWSAALEGVHAAYLIPPDEPIPAEAFVAAAERAGVRRLVAQSGRCIHVLAEAVGVGPEAIGMYALQEAVRASDVEWTVLQPNNFNENFSEGDYHGALLAGELALPVEGTVEPFIAVDDIAAVAAAVLTEDGHHGRIYELSGPEALTFADAIEVLAKASGRPMAFRVETPEEHAAVLRSAELPEDLVFFLDAMYRVMREGALGEVATGVQDVLGREPVAFADWAARAAAAGAWKD
ncbi:NAD(P)H-binding protein [Glycomyces sp. TRM65418]|uniref:NAD(P)H-binding protein n=1 Tax=Glycomyces sp. TRM65418 TaxID=2867006 RepID=UPI001CE5EC4B|nr:NAD(P)H-binding protein [Glycomyces sp. TRM65418]MCC3763051.1 NAD(P)H-binding protein [Glycomyces sp. TRM65418]QZD57065.1 NAD(P)H-binding protein [Glycomyces sp. TRM65418]